MENNRLKKIFHNAFKLSGFNIRREYADAIVDKLIAESFDLNDAEVFDSCIQKLCTNLERQCLHDKCIDAEHIQKAVEVYLNAGYDKHESTFNVINVFDYPRLKFDVDRKRFFLDKRKPTFLSNAESKAQLYLDRYHAVLQRTKRNFKNKLDGEDKLELQTVDYLLTLSHKTLDKTLILGSLLEVSDGKFALEDPTGIVDLDLTHAKYHGGLFVECTMVLVNGYYEDRKLTVSSIILPPGEEYKDSKLSFNNINYFGGDSLVPLRESLPLKEHAKRNEDGLMFIFSEVWLDHPAVFEKLEFMFAGIAANPPIAFIFMGNFMSESHGSEKMSVLKKLFKELGELINRYPSVQRESEFVFVPGMLDPCMPHIVPRFPLPEFVTIDLLKLVPKAKFATNPCRIQYCNKEIVCFRADVVTKLMQASLYKPPKEEVGNCITRTIVSQGHLSPMSLNALTVHWDFDYTLQLYPLPDLIIMGDKSEAYRGKYKGCQVINPGSFCDSGFQFVSYTPYNDELDDCSL